MTRVHGCGRRDSELPAVSGFSFLAGAATSVVPQSGWPSIRPKNSIVIRIFFYESAVGEATGTDPDCQRRNFPQLTEPARLRQLTATCFRGRFMDADHIQAIAARDQLWSSLQSLLPEIERLAESDFDGSPRQQQIVQVLARIVTAELKFRRDEAPS
jgi:hypothetical protein